MPDLYCQCCKQTTPHKSVMRRCEETTTFTQKFTELLGQIASGKHYYKMEPQNYCRVCNTQHVAKKPVVSQTPDRLGEAVQLGVH